MQGAGSNHSILVVDDDRGLAQLIKRSLDREGLTALTVDSGEAALAWLDHNRPELMLLDLKLEDIEGRELVERLLQRGRCPPFIIITGQGDERVAVEMMKRGARDYLVKDMAFLQFVPEIVKRSLEQLDNERRLTRAEQDVHLIRSVVDQGFSAVLITGPELPDPQIVYANPAFARATGYPLAQIIGQPLSTVSSLTNVQRRLGSGLPKGTRFIEEISTYETAQGERWGEWRVGPVQDKSGKNTHWLIIFRDITERMRLEKEVLEISDQEQLRLGQDLHDGLCQHLAGIELMSQVLEQKLAARSKADAARAGEIARHVRDAISQTRALARGLSPVTLESEGLLLALKELSGNTEKMFGISCRVDAPDVIRTLAPAAATHLYRIAQEAVSNAIKHGKASEVVIRLESAGDSFLLRVSDNGGGISDKPMKSQGMGLRIMEYRAGMIGGQLSIARNPEGGTTVQCSAPTHREIRAHPDDYSPSL